MPLDGVTATALSQELNARLADARVDKIMQPDRYTIVLTFYTGRRQEQITISANPSLPAIYPGSPRQENPKTAPPFCMMLRKYLLGSRLRAVETPAYERIFIFKFSTVDDYLDRVEKSLIVELIHRRTNIILVNQTGIIHDAIIHVDHSINRVREILPAHPYLPPPAQDKLSPNAWLENYQLGKDPFPAELAKLKLEKGIVASVLGLSPFLARQIVFASGLDFRLQIADLKQEQRAVLAKSLSLALEMISARKWQPTLYYASENDQDPLDFYALDLPSYLVKKSIASLGEAMQIFGHRQNESNRFEQKQQQLMRKISQEIEAIARKAEIHRRDVEAGEKTELWRYYGELILANIWQYEENSSQLKAIDYYDPDLKEIIIPLKANLSASANAKSYFQKSKKAKNKLAMASKLLALENKALAWLDAIKTALENSLDLEDLEALAAEFKHYRASREQRLKLATLDATAGKKASFLPAEKAAAQTSFQPGKPGKRKKYRPLETKGKSRRESGKADKPLPPRQFFSSDGFLILLGRSNLQNDQLTFRLADKEDTWLHVKNAAGAHAIIRSAQAKIPERAIEEAAGLVAWFSRKNKSPAKVEVDYCLVKNVRKPKSANPGHVIYDNYRTILIEPLNPLSLKKPLSKD